MVEPFTRTETRPGSSRLVVSVASLAGLIAFFYPFVLPALHAEDASRGEPRTTEAPLVLAAVSAACLGVILAELSSPDRRDRLGARSVALLAALVALDALLRLVPTVGGASPIFGLIFLVGVAYGPSPGFAMGSLTLLVSAMITGGVGPWLPYQMLAAGWVGLTAGWLHRRGFLVGPTARFILAAVAGAWGLLYGALMNLYSWPFLAPGVGTGGGIYWEPGLSLAETSARYLAYYLATSLAHDFLRACANVAFVLLLGPALLRLLDRFLVHATWEVWDAGDRDGIRRKTESQPLGFPP